MTHGWTVSLSCSTGRSTADADYNSVTIRRTPGVRDDDTPRSCARRCTAGTRRFRNSSYPCCSCGSLDPSVCPSTNGLQDPCEARSYARRRDDAAGHVPRRRAIEQFSASVNPIPVEHGADVVPMFAAAVWCAQRAPLGSGHIAGRDQNGSRLDPPMCGTASPQHRTVRPRVAAGRPQDANQHGPAHLNAVRAVGQHGHQGPERVRCGLHRAAHRPRRHQHHATGNARGRRPRRRADAIGLDAHDADRVLRDAAAAGVDLPEITSELEHEGGAGVLRLLPRAARLHRRQTRRRDHTRGGCLTAVTAMREQRGDGHAASRTTPRSATDRRARRVGRIEWLYLPAAPVEARDASMCRACAHAIQRLAEPGVAHRGVVDEHHR